jgi:hypothetical protein
LSGILFLAAMVGAVLLGKKQTENKEVNKTESPR